MHEFWKQPAYAVLSGSHLYGTNTSSSDDDIRGFVVPPKEYLVGLSNFEQYEPKSEDLVIFSLKKYFQLLCNGNLQALEILFAPANNVLVCDGIGNLVREKRDLFISKRYARSITGFATAEWRKVRGVRQTINDEQDHLHNLCGHYKLRRQERDEIISIIENSTGVKIAHEYSNLPQIGKQRKDSFEQYGYCVKNACHTVRLLEQGIELLSTGKITFPRPNAYWLQQIRNGDCRFEDIEKRVNNLFDKLRLANEQSELPKVTNQESVNALYMECIKDNL